ncbi:MAG: serine/threonine protein kinase [Deltaproteobacteria bacterium]|nr:serine/threonine protein kinase [Deltaproteobacteria bacterium]
MAPLGTIGNFRLMSCIGRGGMGEVYRAVHTDIQTEVAVKLLHPEISREVEHVQRFFNEARAVGRVKHAGIVKIFDVGFHDDRAYLIMELLEGESLAQRLARGRMSATQIAEVGRQIASVLDSTHRAGVTHRDLKPDNIFLVTDDDLGGRERVKVLDFGIAKLSGPMATGSVPRTVGAIGTPAYMAPEQWADSSKVTAAADTYSLGCVLFEMGCGRPPFRAATMAEACASHLHAAPPAMRSLYPDTPPALDALVGRLLAKEPLERPVMSEIAAELRAFGSDVLPLAPTIGAWSPTPPRVTAPTTIELGTGEVHKTKPVHRAIVGSLVVGVLVGGLAILTTLLRGSGEPVLVDAPPAAVSHAPTATPIVEVVPRVVTPASRATTEHSRALELAKTQAAGSGSSAPDVASSSRMPVSDSRVPARVGRDRAGSPNRTAPNRTPPRAAPASPAAITPAAPPSTSPTRSPPSTSARSKFDGVDLGSDGIPTKR